MKVRKQKIQTKNKSYDLADCALYKVLSKKRLEKILLSSLSELKKLTNDSNYITFYEKSDVNKKRLIERPNERLDFIHTRIASLISRVKQPDYMHSGLKGRSYITNAQAHLGNSPTLTTDIRSFFPSTLRNKVFYFFHKKLNCSADVAELLSHICTINGHIPTGSRISMPLAYWANSEMFNRLDLLAHSYNARMTVYVDDVTFSGAGVNGYFLHKVKRIIESEGHAMHPNKTIIFRRDDVKIVTGVIVLSNELKARNLLHKNIFSDMELWKKINGGLEKEALKKRLLGRIYAAANIENRFKDKARTLKKSD